MYFVRGVASILRKGSVGAPDELSQGSEGHTQNLAAQPLYWQEVLFSGDNEEEGHLDGLWEAYQHASGQDEKKRALEAFLTKFIQTYKNWTPVDVETRVALPSFHEGGGFVAGSSEQKEHTYYLREGTSVGCMKGHPTKVVVGLIQELKAVIQSISEFHSMTDVMNEEWLSFLDVEATLQLLIVLKIVTRSSNNRRVFSFFGGMQSLMGLMKAAVVKLKGVAIRITTENDPPPSIHTQMSFLQCMIAHIVSIVGNYIDAEGWKGGAYFRGRGNDHTGVAQELSDASVSPLESRNLKTQVSSGDLPLRQRSSNGSESAGEWSILNASDTQSGAVGTLPLLETGGLNWFVELLRILRKLRLKGASSDISLEQLTLKTLREALLTNPRSQNHFRSIGGLEVLITGVGTLPTPGLYSGYTQKDAGISNDEWASLLVDFQMQVLSLQVFREAIFRNVNSLQALRDYGGVETFSKIIRFAAFTIPEINSKLWPTSSDGHLVESPVMSPSSYLVQHETSEEKRTRERTLLQGREDTSLDGEAKNMQEILSQGLPARTDVAVSAPELLSEGDDLPGWNRRVADLCRILCSFLVPSGDVCSFASGLARSQDAPGVSGAYWESATRFIVNVLLGIFRDRKESTSRDSEIAHMSRSMSSTLQHYVLFVLKKMLETSPYVVHIFHEDGIWDVMFSKQFFYLGLPLEEQAFGSQIGSTSRVTTHGEEVPVSADFNEMASGDHVLDSLDAEPLRLEVISFVELAATADGSNDNLPECGALLSALQRCSLMPRITTMLVKSLHRVLQLAVDPTVCAFKNLDAATIFASIMEWQMQRYQELCGEALISNLTTIEVSRDEESCTTPVKEDEIGETQGGAWHVFGDIEVWQQARESLFTLFSDFLALCEDSVIEITQKSRVVNALFNLLFDRTSTKFALEHILMFMKLPPKTDEDQDAKMVLCLQYLETLPIAQVKCRGAEISLLMSLLSGLREVLETDLTYYQALFREGECFVHIVSLLNDEHSAETGLQLSLDVILTLTRLLEGNEASKVAFRGLVGVGYKTLQGLLVAQDCGSPSQTLLEALLDMLVDGHFSETPDSIIQNEDVILLFFNLLRKCNEQEQCKGLDTFYRLLEESTANQASCVRSGLLSFLLDWFAVAQSKLVIIKIAQLVQMVGGHSISGKDMRRIFALLRSTNDHQRPEHGTLLLKVLQGMLQEEGPAVFFEMSGKDSGIVVTTPLRWPSNRGFSFSCWMRVQRFHPSGKEDVEASVVGLFSFLSENGKGYTALLHEDHLIFECNSNKKQMVSVGMRLQLKKWHFLCITHSTGRVLAGGNTLKAYLDGVLVNSEKFRYPRLLEPLIRCTIGASSSLPVNEGNRDGLIGKFSAPLCGQLGPIYLFDDVLSSDQVFGIHSLGPGYMYSFLANDIGRVPENIISQNVIDSRDGLASKIVFGYNAQASGGRALFDVSPVPEQLPNRTLYDASIMGGTHLCYRRLAQDSVHSVGGVAVFYPLLVQLNKCASNNTSMRDLSSTECEALNAMSDKGLPVRVKTESDFSEEIEVAVEVIELVTAVLAKNHANQQYMHNISGLSILGYLLQSMSPERLTVKFVSAIERLLITVVTSSSTFLSQALAEEVLSKLYLNPHIWIFAPFVVQRVLYSSLLDHAEKYISHLKNVCNLARILDIVQQFYWDKAKKGEGLMSKTILHSVTKAIKGERPSPPEVAELRLLVLGVAETLLRNDVQLHDTKALIAFLETSEDPSCLEDVLRMVLGLFTHKQFVAKFVEQIFTLGGCHLFVNLLKSSQESIRLLGLRIIGAALVAAPPEKKGFGLFVGSGGSKAALEQERIEKLKLSHLFTTIQAKILVFPFTDMLRATLFDMLLGVASPKQAFREDFGQAQGWSARKNSEKTTNSAGSIALPQMLEIIMKFVLHCEDSALRLEIMEEVLRLLEESPLNCEAIVQQSAWQEWFFAVLIEGYNRNEVSSRTEKVWMMGREQFVLRNILSVVHTHFVLNIKGGSWYVERTVDFIYLRAKQGNLNKFYALHVILSDLFERILKCSPQILIQPCRDNVLHLLTFVDELVLPHAFSLLSLSSDPGLEDTDDSNLLSGGYIGLDASIPVKSSLKTVHLHELAVATATEGTSAESAYNFVGSSNSPASQGEVVESVDRTHYWRLYDHVWTILSLLHGRRSGGSKYLFPATLGPSFGQRARDLVESINIPGAEMAAAVVSGGLGVVGITSSHRGVEKSIKLKGEKYPRVIFQLTLLYIYEAELGVASRSVQQLLNLLPGYLSVESESTRNKLQLFLWALLRARTQIGALDDGARFHVVSQLIRETVDVGKSLLVSSLPDSAATQEESGNSNESAVHSLLQWDRISAAVKEESKYIDGMKLQREQEVDSLHKEILEANSWESQPSRAFHAEIMNSLALICSADCTRRHSFQLVYDEQQQAISDHWCHLYRDMTDERGPWAVVPFPNNSQARWKLDKTEDPSRRRFKTKRNYHFNEELLYPPQKASQSQPGENATKDLHSNRDTTAVNLIEGSVKEMLLKGLHGFTEEVDIDNKGDEERDIPELEMESECATTSDSVEEENKSSLEQGDATLKVVEGVAHPMGLNSPHTGDGEVILSVACVFISPKRKLAGRLELMRSCIHFYGEFIVEGTGGSSIFTQTGGLRFPNTYGTDLSDKETSRLKKESIPGSIGGDIEKGNAMERLDPVRNVSMHGGTGKNVKRHRRWDLFQVKGVQGTRYLLQFTALEFFFYDSTPPVFFNFPSHEHAKDISTMIASLRSQGSASKPGTKDKGDSVLLIDKRRAVEMAERSKDCWKRREISNFDYLMALNTLAGRSYNDLTQYPVFPWIIADYTSEKLDLANPATFRDLSRPVGALNQKRFQMFEERYRSFTDPDIPSFYYGSHYSSMGIVLFYLLRLEPFTTLHRHLQGGKFDHADRLFHSIAGAFANCLTNTSDVKELLPEFFYLPEFLVNTNEFFIGVKQDGEQLGDVVLPPWAKDAEDFVQKNREALESEYVSEHIHEWIDLVFGYKQRGSRAAEAGNVFYHLTYEGSVDLDAMENPLERAAIEDQIANFGQTPIQLFRQKHPKRGLPMPISRPLYYAPASICLTSSIPPSSGQLAGHDNLSTAFVGLVDGKVVTVSSGLTISVRSWLTASSQGGSFTFSSQDAIGIGSDSILVRRMGGGALVDDVPVNPGCFGTLHVRSHSFLLTCGQWDNSFKVVSLLDGRIVQSNCHHKDVINCLSVAVDGSVVVTGSCDTTVMVWEVELAKMRRLGATKNASGTSERSGRMDPVIISNRPLHVLCGHDDAVTCVVIKVELDLVVSGSKDSTCILHTLRQGRYVRSLQHPNRCSISRVLVSQHARLIMFSNEDLNFHLFSVNGKKLAEAETNGRVNCMELSTCGEFLVYGCDHGQIVVRSLYTLEVIRKYDGSISSITALTVTPEECFLVGTQDGELLVYAVQPQQHQQRKTNTSKILSSLRRPSLAAF